MAPLSFDDLLMILGNRVYLYELAHTVFGGEPDERLVEALADETAAQALCLAADAPDDAYDRLRSYLADLADAPSRSETVAALRASYMQLVQGPDLNEAYPWESMYVSHRRLLFQKNTLEVRETYRAFGYAAYELGKVPDDHISLECAFMARMAQRTFDVFSRAVSDDAADGAQAEATNACGIDSDELAPVLDGQESFLREHATQWFSSYARDLKAVGEGSLYACVADMVAAFVEDDLETIESVRVFASGRGIG